jgi:hypothetical protein
MNTNNFSKAIALSKRAYLLLFSQLSLEQRYWAEDTEEFKKLEYEQRLLLDMIASCDKMKTDNDNHTTTLRIFKN